MKILLIGLLIYCVIGCVLVYPIIFDKWWSFWMIFRSRWIVDLTSAIFVPFLLVAVFLGEMRDRRLERLGLLIPMKRIGNDIESQMGFGALDARDFEEEDHWDG